MQELTMKMPAEDPELENPAAQTLCKPAESKRTWACHKSHFMREFTGKMLRPKTKENSRGRLCASQHSRNAHGHVTRAYNSYSMRELMGKKPEAPWSSTGLRKKDTLFGVSIHCAVRCVVVWAIADESTCDGSWSTQVHRQGKGIF